MTACLKIEKYVEFDNFGIDMNEPVTNHNKQISRSESLA